MYQGKRFPVSQDLGLGLPVDRYSEVRDPFLIPFCHVFCSTGFVEWEAGKLADGSDSLARQVAPASHWPEMAAVICVVSDRKKETSSTAGMQTSVATSELMATRIRDCVPKRIEDIKKAILEKDFETFVNLRI